MSISRTSVITIAAVCGAWASFANAKLPPPTPQEQEQAEQKKAKAAAEAQEQKAALTKVQDQIAARYIAAQQAKGITVTPTPIAAAAPAAATTKEVPAAAMDNRPTEKAGAYNEQVSPQSAQTSAATGSPPNGQKPNDQKPDEQKK